MAEHAGVGGMDGAEEESGDEEAKGEGARWKKAGWKGGWHSISLDG
jgi:hypothetical protein